ncbi:MAG: hypothetical protein ACKO85_07160 [Isosphaeraceae bacterium]
MGGVKQKTERLLRARLFQASLGQKITTPAAFGGHPSGGGELAEGVDFKGFKEPRTK